ncbi:glycosyltransferase family 2 protein [Streptomyces calvus]|uniref:Glycosyltransferase involved in cell wall biosynthesis n=2 Tax=Streptomyces calvus TaxID=67282 RepID=A0AA40SA07_9ACTN|nr:glycosyltransferase family 2 protein [Streptomyces calvus]MBA8942519.1 glycosyltransferase involved in cell wall biosynthesis [Streptomyces calvus]GGP68875.1 glycosyl transferase [Streptomyces calvus]
MKLSVIVPMYNVRDYCATTLKSLAFNARSDFEFIVIDDCSTDGTAEILQREIRKVPGAVLYRTPQNSGISATRNAGLRLATGKYIAFLDGDDWFAPGYLGRLVDAIEQLGCHFVRTDHIRVVGKKREVVRSPQAVRNTPLRPIESIMPVNASTMVDYPLVWAGIFDREVLAARDLLFFDEKLRTAEDRMWTWRLHLHTDSYAAVDLAGIFYRRDVSTSLTRIPDERQLDFIPCFDRVAQEVAAHPWGRHIMPKVIRTYCAMMAIHLDRADTYEEDVRALLKSRIAGALERLPQQLLERTLDEMGAKRAKLINSVRDLAVPEPRPSDAVDVRYLPNQGRRATWTPRPGRADGRQNQQAIGVTA